MNRRLFLSMLLALGSTGCVRPAPPAFVPVQTIAVFPPNNRTGDPLLIAGASFFEKYVLPTDRYTVADALAANARAELVQRGFDVVAPELVTAATTEAPSSAENAASVAMRNHIDGAVLYIEIRRWEPDVPYKPTGIIVAVAVTLIDPVTGHVLWTADHPLRPVQTPGVINLGDAYSVAARTVMTELLAPLSPQRFGSSSAVGARHAAPLPPDYYRASCARTSATGIPSASPTRLPYSSCACRKWPICRTCTARSMPFMWPAMLLASRARSSGFMTP